MTPHEAVEKLLKKGRRFFTDRIQYVPCPRFDCAGLLVRLAYDAAECAGCGYREAYLD